VGSAGQSVCRQTIYKDDYCILQSIISQLQIACQSRALLLTDLPATRCCCPRPIKARGGQRSPATSRAAPLLLPVPVPTQGSHQGSHHAAAWSSSSSWRRRSQQAMQQRRLRRRRRRRRPHRQHRRRQRSSCGGSKGLRSGGAGRRRARWVQAAAPRARQEPTSAPRCRPPAPANAAGAAGRARRRRSGPCRPARPAAGAAAAAAAHHGGGRADPLAGGPGAGGPGGSQGGPPRQAPPALPSCVRRSCAGMHPVSRLRLPFALGRGAAGSNMDVPHAAGVAAVPRVLGLLRSGLRLQDAEPRAAGPQVGAPSWVAFACLRRKGSVRRSASVSGASSCQVAAARRA
jgi:hypothetical protein